MFTGFSGIIRRLQIFRKTKYEMSFTQVPKVFYWQNSIYTQILNEMKGVFALQKIIFLL